MYVLFQRGNQPQSTVKLYSMCLGGGRSKGGVEMEYDAMGRRGRVVSQTSLSLIAQVFIT